MHGLQQLVFFETLAFVNLLANLILQQNRDLECPSSHQLGQDTCPTLK